MASDIDDFADEEEAGDAAGFHGFARELARVHSAGGDFGFFVAFGGGGDESPGVELLFESSERGIGVSARGETPEARCGQRRDRGGWIREVQRSRCARERDRDGWADSPSSRKRFE